MFWLNALAKPNIKLILVTLLVFQAPMFWLKAVLRLNILIIIVTVVGIYLGTKKFPATLLNPVSKLVQPKLPHDLTATNVPVHVATGLVSLSPKRVVTPPDTVTRYVPALVYVLVGLAVLTITGVVPSPQSIVLSPVDAPKFNSTEPPAPTVCSDTQLTDTVSVPFVHKPVVPLYNHNPASGLKKVCVSSHKSPSIGLAGIAVPRHNTTGNPAGRAKLLSVPWSTY